MQYKALILFCPIWDLSCKDFLKKRTVVYLSNFYFFTVFLSTFWSRVELNEGQKNNVINPFFSFNFQARWVSGRSEIGPWVLRGPQSFSQDEKLKVKDRKNKNESCHSNCLLCMLAEESSERTMEEWLTGRRKWIKWVLWGCGLYSEFNLFSHLGKEPWAQLKTSSDLKHLRKLLSSTPDRSICLLSIILWFPALYIFTLQTLSTTRNQSFFFFFF